MTVTLGGVWRIDDVARPLGQGGYGRVWRAVHVEVGLPVAVKVMTHPSWREEAGRRRFRDEVRLMAALDHPGIVRPLDVGEVTASETLAATGGTQAATGGTQAATTGAGLAVGAPWMAMELVEGTDLARLRIDRWDVLGSVLVQILEALAHAHARGVVHGDLTPANVLWDGRVRVTDLGLARALAEAGDGVVRGTRGYMAPEQLQGRWRDVGPATDLYALGCVAWARLCGSPLGPWNPAIAVPDGVYSVLCRLREPDPSARFDRAADVLAALEALGPPSAVRRPPSAGHAASETLAATNTEVTATADVEPQEPEADGGRRTADGGSWTADGGRATRAPVPADPIAPEPLEAPALQLLRMAGERPALFGLRELPLVGRDEACRALWTALRGAAEGRPRVALVTGPSGSGRTRLLRWLCERGHETGAATPIVVTSSPSPSPKDGVRGAVARSLRTDGLSGDALVARVRTALGPEATADDVDALAGLVRGDRSAGVTAAIRRWLARIGRGRTVILAVDDAPWAVDALVLAERLGKADLPLLVALSAGDDDPGDRVARSLLVGLARDAVHVPLGPLPADAIADLVRRLPGLAPDVAAEVERRAEGNPGLAVALAAAAAWPDPPARTPAATTALPEPPASPPAATSGLPWPPASRWRLHQLAWADRLRPLLATSPGDAVTSLAVAATLGASVDDREWSAACSRLGSPVATGLVERLAAVGVVRRDAGGFSFANAAAREAVRALREADRPAMEAVCAGALAALYPDPPLDVAERVGRHLAAAGDAGAFAALMAAAEGRAKRGEIRRALSLTGLAADALDRERVAPGDVRRGLVLRYEGELFLLLGQRDEAEALVSTALALARGHGWTRVRGWALRDLAILRGYRGEPAGDALEEALAAFREADDPRGVAFVLQSLANDAQERGELDLAAARFEEAAAAGARAGETEVEAACRLGLATSRLLAGRWEEAERAAEAGLARAGDVQSLVAFGLHFRGAARVGRGDLAGEADVREAAERFERVGNPLWVASCRNTLARCARAAGRLAEAEQGLRDVIAWLDGAGSPEADDARADLVWLLLDQRRFEEAEAVLDRCRAATPLAASQLGLQRAWCASVRGDEAAVRDGLALSRPWLAKGFRTNDTDRTLSWLGPKTEN